MSEEGMGEVRRVRSSKRNTREGVSTPQVEGGMGPVCFHERVPVPADSTPRL